MRYDVQQNGNISLARTQKVEIEPLGAGDGGRTLVEGRVGEVRLPTCAR